MFVPYSKPCYVPGFGILFYKKDVRFIFCIQRNKIILIEIWKSLTVIRKIYFLNLIILSWAYLHSPNWKKKQPQGTSEEKNPQHMSKNIWTNQTVLKQQVMQLGIIYHAVWQEFLVQCDPFWFCTIFKIVQCVPGLLKPNRLRLVIGFAAIPPPEWVFSNSGRLIWINLITAQESAIRRKHVVIVESNESLLIERSQFSKSLGFRI